MFLSSQRNSQYVVVRALLLLFVVPLLIAGVSGSTPPSRRQYSLNELVLRITFGMQVSEIEARRAEIVQATTSALSLSGSSGERVEIVSVVADGSVMVQFRLFSAEGAGQIKDRLTAALSNRNSPLVRDYLAISFSVEAPATKKQALGTLTIVLLSIAVGLSIIIVVAVYIHRKRGGHLTETFPSLPPVETEVRGGQLVVDGSTLVTQKPTDEDAFDNIPTSPFTTNHTSSRRSTLPSRVSVVEMSDSYGSRRSSNVPLRDQRRGTATSTGRTVVYLGQDTVDANAQLPSNTPVVPMENPTGIYSHEANPVMNHPWGSGDLADDDDLTPTNNENITHDENDDEDFSEISAPAARFQPTIDTNELSSPQDIVPLGDDNNNNEQGDSRENREREEDASASKATNE